MLACFHAIFIFVLCKFYYAAYTTSEVINLGKKPEQRKARLQKSNAGTFAKNPDQGIAPKKKKKD